MSFFPSGICGLRKRSPAFLLGLEFLLGLSFAATHHLTLLLIGALLLYPLFRNDQEGCFARAPVYFLTCLIGLIYGYFFFKVPAINLPCKGSALFSPQSVKLQKSLFHSSYVYKGEIEYFAGDDGTSLYHLPCSLYAPKGYERPQAECSFFLTGSLQKRTNTSVEFTTEGPWHSIEGTFSFAEMRFKAKRAIQNFIKKNVKTKKSADFFYALCTGEVEDRLLSFEFSKAGLQHILAVSGFHFALIALFVGFLLRRIFSEKISLILLLITLSIYFFFLGNSPSVFRAWIAITLWSLGRLFHRKTTGLNTLGICLLIELIFDPRVIFHLGFQLSFLCTAAILLCSPIVLKWMQTIFPKRSLSELEQLSKTERVAYLGCSFFRTALALTLAVHIASVPVCLYHFQSFPLLSLAYNLYFPFLTGISLYLFLAALLLTFIAPPLGKFLFTIDTAFTSWLLDTSANPPVMLEHSLRVPSLPLSLVLIYLFVLLAFFSALTFRQKLA